MLQKFFKALLTSLGLLSLADSAAADFAEFAAELAPGDNALLESVKHAATNPSAYVKSHPSASDRFFSPERAVADPSLPWLVLLDALIEKGIVVELDWKLDPDLTMSALESLGAFTRLASEVQAEIRTAFQQALENEEATGDFLHQAAKGVRKTDDRLALMRINSDSFPVLVLPASKFEKLAEIAKKLREKLNIGEEKLDLADLAERVY